MKNLTKISLMGIVSCTLMGSAFADYSSNNSSFNTPASNSSSYSDTLPSSSDNAPSSDSMAPASSKTPSSNSMAPISSQKMSKSDLLANLTPENRALYDKIGKKGQDLALKLLNNECTTPDACDGFYYGPVRSADEAVRVAYEAIKSNPPSSTPSTQQPSSSNYRSPSQRGTR